VTWGYGEPAEHVGGDGDGSDVREVADLLGVELVSAPLRGAA
jgi:phosphoglycolate phosphatase